jgi:hypothetical protein
VGENTLVDAIRLMIDKIIIENGKINLFMLLGDLEEREAGYVVVSYTMVVSAKWMDHLTPREGTELVANYLFTKLPSEYIVHISRVTVVSTLDESVTNITNNIGQHGGYAVNYGCRFGDVNIPFCIIFESRL